MHGKVKTLRESGKRMSDQKIAAAIPVEGEIRVYGIGNTIQAAVVDPNSQVSAPLLVLYEARITTMHGSSMLLKGEERPQGETGPAYIQEWSVRLTS